MKKKLIKILKLLFLPIFLIYDTLYSELNLFKKIFKLFFICSLLLIWYFIWSILIFIFFSIFKIDKNFEDNISSIITTIFLLYFAIYSFKKKKRINLLSIISFIFSILIIISILFIEPSQIIGQSMYPTLNNGDFILISKIDKDYKRGDIIVFKNSKNKDIVYISRIIALPKDKIKIQQGKVYLNDKLLKEPYTKISTNLWQDGFIKTGKEYEIPDNMVFVMSDNRPSSFDSREFGFVDISSIKGKYIFTYYKNKYELNKEKKVKYLFSIGENFYLNSQSDEAIKYFQELIKIEPNHQNSLIYLADIFTRKKQYKEAEIYFKKSFQINKNNAYLLAKYGYYLQSKGNENEAEEYYKKALAINNSLYDALYGLGYINLNRGQYLKAEEYFNKILSTGVNDAFTFHNLGAIYSYLKNYKKAKEFYNKALNLYKEKGLNSEYDELYKFMQENKLN